MPAGDNEKIFRERMNGHIKGKLSFNDEEKTYISVDGHFVHNNKLYLLEIDSGNQAKLLAGQYILINALWKDKNIGEKKYLINDCIFLVVHFFKSYNAERTTSTLNDIKAKFNLSLPVMAIHESQVDSWEKLLNLISRNKEKK